MKTYVHIFLGFGIGDERSESTDTGEQFVWRPYLAPNRCSRRNAVASGPAYHNPYRFIDF